MLRTVSSAAATSLRVKPYLFSCFSSCLPSQLPRPRTPPKSARLAAKPPCKHRNSTTHAMLFPVHCTMFWLSFVHPELELNSPVMERWSPSLLSGPMWPNLLGKIRFCQDSWALHFQEQACIISVYLSFTCLCTAWFERVKSLFFLAQTRSRQNFLELVHCFCMHLAWLWISG